MTIIICKNSFSNISNVIFINLALFKITFVTNVKIKVGDYFLFNLFNIIRWGIEVLFRQDLLQIKIFYKKLSRLSYFLYEICLFLILQIRNEIQNCYVLQKFKVFETVFLTNVL